MRDTATAALTMSSWHDVLDSYECKVVQFWWCTKIHTFRIVSLLVTRRKMLRRVENMRYFPMWNYLIWSKLHSELCNWWIIAGSHCVHLVTLSLSFNVKNVTADETYVQFNFLKMSQITNCLWIRDFSQNHLVNWHKSEAEISNGLRPECPTEVRPHRVIHDFFHYHFW